MNLFQSLQSRTLAVMFLKSVTEQEEELPADLLTLFVCEVLNVSGVVATHELVTAQLTDGQGLIVNMLDTGCTIEVPEYEWMKSLRNTQDPKDALAEVVVGLSTDQIADMLFRHG